MYTSFYFISRWTFLKYYVQDFAVNSTLENFKFELLKKLLKKKYCKLSSITMIILLWILVQNIWKKNVLPYDLSCLLLCQIWFSIFFRDFWLSVLLIYIYLKNEMQLLWKVSTTASTPQVQCHFATWSRKCIERPHTFLSSLGWWLRKVPEVP